MTCRRSTTPPSHAPKIEYCDRFPLDDLPDEARHLLQLLHSLAMVSYAVEVWRQQLPIDIGAATMDRIAEPRL